MEQGFCPNTSIPSAAKTPTRNITAVPEQRQLSSSSNLIIGSFTPPGRKTARFVEYTDNPANSTIIFDGTTSKVMDRSSGLMSIRGHLKNIGPKTFVYLTIDAILYDQNNRTLGKDSTGAEPDVGPGQSLGLFRPGQSAVFTFSDLGSGDPFLTPDKLHDIRYIKYHLSWTDVK